MLGGEQGLKSRLHRCSGGATFQVMVTITIACRGRISGGARVDLSIARLSRDAGRARAGQPSD